MDTINFAQSLKVAGEQKLSSEIRIGLIGCGYWGPNLIRNFHENPQANLVVVADLKQERLNFIHNSYPEVKLIADYHEMYSMGLDAIVIATPPTTHYEIAKDVIQHGYNVMIEKPLTLRSDHAIELIELARKNDVTLMVGHAFEYNIAVQTLKSMIANGDLGEVHYIDSARLNLGLYQHGLNVLWDLAPHDFSILCYILGQEPISVTAQGTSCVAKHIIDVAYINLRFPGNILAHVHVSWLDPYKVRRVTVVGSKKMVVFNDVDNDKIKIVDKGVGVTINGAASSFNEFQYSYRNGDILIPFIKFVEPLKVECQHFLDCIREHRHPVTDGEDGLRVVRILEAAQRSLENNSREELL